MLYFVVKVGRVAEYDSCVKRKERHAARPSGDFRCAKTQQRATRAKGFQRVSNADHDLTAIRFHRRGAFTTRTDGTDYVPRGTR